MKKRGSGCVVRSERRVAHQHISITHNLSDLEAGTHRISVHGSINGHILSVSLQETLFGLGVPSLISVSAANLYARIRNCCILPPMLQLCVLTAAARAMAHILLCDTQSAFGHILPVCAAITFPFIPGVSEGRIDGAHRGAHRHHVQSETGRE